MYSIDYYATDGIAIKRDTGQKLINQILGKVFQEYIVLPKF